MHFSCCSNFFYQPSSPKIFGAISYLCSFVNSANLATTTDTVKCPINSISLEKKNDSDDWEPVTTPFSFSATADKDITVTLSSEFKKTIRIMYNTEHHSVSVASKEFIVETTCGVTSYTIAPIWKEYEQFQASNSVTETFWAGEFLAVPPGSSVCPFS